MNRSSQQDSDSHQQVNGSKDSVALSIGGEAVLNCFDFKTCRDAAREVSAVHFEISKGMVREYSPEDESGFVDLLTFYSSLFSDKREAAGLFGVSVSTFYRWKSGQTVPHALVRSSVHSAIKKYLINTSFADLGSPPPAPPRIVKSVSSSVQ